jgi:dihydrodipicolinate synthase/N-acetylneuraminate lyase
MLPAWRAGCSSASQTTLKPGCPKNKRKIMKNQMRGVYSIPVTPFNLDGSVDFDSLSNCVEWCVEKGAHGIVFPVNASEGPFLTDSERAAVIQTGVKATANAVPFVAGVSGITTSHAVEYTKAAIEAGADSVIAAPPNGSNPELMLDYYGAVAEAAGVPLWVQNNKPPTSPTIPTPLIVRMLKEIEHIDYVKEESLVPGQVMTELFELSGDACHGVMGGMGGRFLTDEYHRGSCGTMPSGHITDAHRKLWDALEKGGKGADGLQVVTDEAQAIWELLLPSLNFEFLFSITVYKMVFHRRGVIKTPATRNPAAKKMDKLDVDELDRILARLDPLLD